MSLPGGSLAAMSEQPVEDHPSTEVDAAAEGEPEADRPRTGVAGVDAVVDDVAALDARPLEEHGEVFEDAHERLRRALDDTHDTGPA